MEWKEEYSVGIIELDDQHKLMLKSFTAIKQLVSTDDGWSRTHYAIVELIQLARLHFSFEEAMMRMFDFPDRAAHVKEHQHFFSRLDNIERLSLKKSTKVEMIHHLQDWMTSHIVGYDQDYAKHIFSGAQVVLTNRATP